MTTTDDRTTAAAVDPGPLIKLTIADCAAKVLHSAVTLGVFAALAEGPAGADHVVAATGLHKRMAADFLDALAGLGLLERTGDQYGNGPLAEAYLVPGTATYLGGFVELTNETLYGTWGGSPRPSPPEPCNTSTPTRAASSGTNTRTRGR